MKTCGHDIFVAAVFCQSILKTTLLILAFCFLADGSAMAQNSATTPVWQGGFSASVMKFDYTEFDQNNQIFNREHGTLPGVVAGVKRTKGAMQIQARLAYYRNDVRYDGQTQSGKPASSRTNESITDISLLLKGLVTEFSPISSTLYGGLGYRHWRRDIQSTPTASGLLEFYQWPYWILGTTAGYHLGPKTSVQFDIQITRPIDPSMVVHFKNINLDSSELELGANLGGRIALTWNQKITQQLSISLEPYHQRWDLERSAAEPLKFNGIMVGGSVAQPRSETRNSGLNFTIIYNFI
ncbi:hypothetical protein MNBD_GAMMA16-1674 [hydrothermal vent metagenome]|uniref:Uncharacterized protein n=1 Tax=hydrothermal vent metagenome TaxID=652676 RepID=A0A3B0YYB1_9ZZZZ